MYMYVHTYSCISNPKYVCKYYMYLVVCFGLLVYLQISISGSTHISLFLVSKAFNNAMSAPEKSGLCP